MTLVQQLTPLTCGLACVESLSIDMGFPVTQAELLKRFKSELLFQLPETWRFGSTSQYLLVEILHQLGFGTELVKPEPLGHLAKRYKANDNSIVVCQCAPGAVHCFRVGRFLSTDLLEVMDPAFDAPSARIIELPLSQLVKWDSYHIFVSAKQ